MVKYDKLIFELSKEGRNGYRLPGCDIEGIDLKALYGDKIMRKDALDLPEVSETQVARHYTLLSNKNYGVDTGFYPLGSCTMKYNPKINEDMANLAGFAALHPYQDDYMSQGALELMFNLQNQLGELTGMDAFSLQPAAGSHGELLGLMLIKAYHDKKEDFKRTKIIVPDSAHGTNPASASVCGMDVVQVKSNADGSVNIDSLKEALSDEIAGLMLTNPSTLGLFEESILEIEKLVHEAGGLIYYDGANMNAIMGKARPGDMGFDVVHLNVHKTLSTPHGGGGPGAGPVGCKEFLREFLPVPAVEKVDDGFALVYDKPYSVGKVKGFYGNFGILVRAYTYILTMGAEGLKHASEMAVLNANYMQERLKEHYYLPIDTVCKHEFVLGGMTKGLAPVSTLDIAKRLLDYGYHPPTIYFPLIINEAMMIEPTETESKETMDGFIDTLIQIKEEANTNPEILKQAPTTASVRRIDEVKAARNPILKWERVND